jgi:hypothetical protein
MSLAEGDRPADGDVWFRIITSTDYITRGRVNHSAFKGKNFFRRPPAGANRPWTVESSGRLRSLAGSTDAIAEYAELYAAANRTKFIGVMYPSEPLDRATVGPLTLDFCYTPIPGGDNAHADLIATGTMPADKTPDHDQLLLELVDCFKALFAGQIEHLPAANIKPPTLSERLQQAIKSVFPKGPV